jgi:hypothetical protein
MSKKYIVQVKEVHAVELEIEAESSAEARTKANEMLHEEEYMGQELEYSHTMEPEEWTVEEKG